MASKRGKKSAAPKPFASKAQWKLFAANPRLKKYFHDKAVATTGTSVHGTPQGKAAYGRLPKRKGKPSVRSARGK
jgi:hypothetical protein